MNYFTQAKDIDELKAEYKTLCKKYHPDLNIEIDTTSIQQEINKEYEEKLKTATRFSKHFNKDIPLTEKDIETEKEIKEIILKTIHLKGLIVELCGRWIWFSGESKKYKEFLKELGCKYAPKKKVWYWRPADAKVWRKSKKKLDLDEIRGIYGSKVFTKNESFYLQKA